MDNRLRTNAVIQISDTHPAEEYHSLFGIIKDVRTWGVLAYVYLDNDWGLVGVQNENFYYIGKTVLGFTDEEEIKCKCETTIPIEGADAKIICGNCQNPV